MSSQVDKVLSFGRPTSRQSVSVSVESFSPPAIPSQLLRPLSVTNSILDPVDSPWPGLASTPSPAWNVSMASTLCNDELTNIPVSIQLSNSTKNQISGKQSFPSPYFPTRIANSRPIGADVLLSSSSSVASEIQEQMSQSVRQKQLIGSQMLLPERSPVTSSSAMETSNSATTDSLSLNFSCSESLPVQHSTNAFKSHGISVKPAFIQSPTQLVVDKEILERVQHVEPASNPTSDIKNLSIHSNYDIKLMGNQPSTANHLMNTDSKIREEAIVKDIDSINKRNKFIFGIPSAIKNFPRVQNHLASSIEQPILPVNVIHNANYNNETNPAVLEPIRLATNAVPPFSIPTPRTGTINVINTVPITQDTSLTIFPSVNTPKMSLITLDNTTKVLPESEISINRSRPPLRRSLKQSNMEPMILHDLSDRATLQNQVIGGKLKSLQNIEIIQEPILNPQQNVSLIIPNEQNLVSSQKLNNAPLIQNDINLVPQRVQNIVTRPAPDLKTHNLNLSMGLDALKKPSQTSSNSYLLDQMLPARTLQNFRANDNLAVIPVNHVQVLPQVPDKLKTKVLRTTLITPDKLSQSIKNVQERPTQVSFNTQNIRDNSNRLPIDPRSDVKDQNSLKYIRSIPKKQNNKQNLNMEMISCKSFSEAKMNTKSDEDEGMIKGNYNRKIEDKRSDEFSFSDEDNGDENQKYSQRESTRTVQKVKRSKKKPSRSSNHHSPKAKRKKDILLDDLIEEEDVEKFGGPQRENKQDPNNDYIETLVCSKCKICGYLTTSSEKISSHLESEHLDVLESSVLSSTSTSTSANTNWLLIAQKHQIPLRCPLCINTFRGTHLSFKVHLMDDHSLNEDDTNAHYDTQNEKRRIETLDHVRKRKEEIERQKKNRKEILEAYVDDKGELRVRTVCRYAAENSGHKSDSEEDPGDDKSSNKKGEDQVDVSAKEYIDVVTISNDATLKTASKCDENIQSSKVGKKLLDLTKSCEKNTTKKIRKEVEIKSNEESVDARANKEETASKISNGNSRMDIHANEVKRNVGRPRGSRSIGLTKLKRLNPRIQMNDKEIGGTECGTNNCAVRLKDSAKLEYHKKCHINVEDRLEMFFECPECKKEAIENKKDAKDPKSNIYSSETWKKMALHLWRVHEIDMELFSCDICHEFKEFTSWRLEAHKIAHQVARPFLCNECGKCFKTNRNLKIHSKLHQESVTPSSKEISTLSETRKIDALNKGGECQTCHKKFTTKRFLRHHIETVHKGLKPLMCNFCG